MSELLALAEVYASGICRIVNPYLAPQGTAFLISDHLLITNSHVVINKSEAMYFQAEFDYEGEKEVTRFNLNPDDFFVTADFDDVDFTIVSLGKPVSGKKKLGDFCSCKISKKESKIGNSIHVIHHPWGGPKKIDLNGCLVGFSEKFIYYNAKTTAGSSGCPVFNDNFEVIGVHRKSVPSIALEKIDGNAHEGVSINAIIEYLKQKQAIEKDSDLFNFTSKKL